MGKKKAKNGDGEKEKSEGQNGITVVLKTEIHCEGCATKILKCVKNIEGVEKAKADWEVNKLTVRGEMDPSKLREKLQEMLKKKVELISPQLPKKDKDDNNKISKDSKKPDDKKPKEKEAPVTTAILKLKLHCLGCVNKIYKIASKTEGYRSISIDRKKELVTVTGTMDMKALAKSLEEKMKTTVAIVSPKKDKDDSGGGGGGGGGGGDGKKNKKQNGGEDEGQAVAAGGMLGGNRMEYMGFPMPSHGPMYGPAAGYVSPYPHHHPYPYPGNNLHAPQLFSDENPNACSIM